MVFEIVIQVNVWAVLANKACGKRSLDRPKRTHLEEEIVLNGAWKALSVVVTNARVCC